MTLHAQRASHDPLRWSTECSCGWKSALVQEGPNADARWRIHAGERQAASSLASAVRLRAAATLRALELSEVRAAARSRRVALREERWRLRSSRADGDRRTDKLQALDPAPWQMLNHVRSFIGCSVSALWMEYFTAGGTASYDEFALMLTGVSPMPIHDHDLTATALNDCFEAAGLGAPVATSEEVLQAPLAGLQQ